MAKQTKVDKPKEDRLAIPRVEEDWEKGLASQARDDRANTATGVPRITHKAQILKIDGQVVAKDPQRGIQIVQAVVLGFAFTKTDYEEPYEEGVAATPRCYAFSPTGKGMAAHDASPEKQNRQPDGSSPCDTCENNKFGTADRGRGKHCRDAVRLLVILAADLQEQGEEQVVRAIMKAPTYQLEIPPTSLRGFNGYLAALGDLTPHGNIREAITEITTESRDGGGYFIITSFTEVVPRAAMPALLKRGEDAYARLSMPFPVLEDDSEKAKPQAPLKGQRNEKRR